MSTSLEIEAEVVTSIVDQVWESLLGSGAPEWHPDLPTDPAGLAAEVALRGDWNGSVRVSCDPTTADRLARTMLAVGPDHPLPEDDVHDALGEVANVVGGNVKGALGGDTSLGLPVVAVRTDGRTPVTRRAVAWHGAPVVVEVFGDGDSTPPPTGETTAS